MKPIVFLIPVFLMAGHNAAAQHDEPGFGPDRDHGHHRPMFAEIDSNDDGTLSAAEIDAHRLERFEELDGDRDGSISRQELTDAIQKRMTRRAEHHGSRMLDRMDTDKDGSISRDEFQSHTDHMLTRLDRNGDGSVSLEEMQHMADHRHGSRGNKRPDDERR